MEFHHTLEYNCIDLSIGNTDFQILFESNFQFQPHTWNSHQHFHLFCECHFLKTGNVLLKTETQNITLENGAFCIIPLDLRHTIQTLNTPIQKISFYIVISQNKNDKNDTFSWFNQFFSAETPFVTFQVAETFQKILELTQSTTKNNFLFINRLKHLFSLVLLELLEQSDESYYSDCTNTSVGYDKELILKIESFMVTHFSLNAQLDDLARYLCLSTRQTNRLLKQTFNCSFQEIKIQKRIEASKQLIVQQCYSLKEIAEAVGYNNYPSFYKAFIKHTGISPEEYRNSLSS